MPAPVVACVLHKVLQNPGTYLDRILNQSLFRKLLESEQPSFRNRVFTPLTTLWCWMIQSLSGDQSCRYAVTALIAHQSRQESCQGKKGSRRQIISSATGAYSQARKRLSFRLIQRLALHLGGELEKILEAHQAWNWKGHSVKIADGTELSVPDTPKNREAFPKANFKTMQWGLPKLRAVGIFSLGSGALLALRTGPVQGRDSGENNLLRRLLCRLHAGDLLLLDRIYSGYVDLALLWRKKIHFIARKQEMQLTDFRRGKRLGKHDHLITLKRPRPGNCPSDMSRRLVPWLSPALVLREVRIVVRIRGFRAKKLDLITSLTDANRYSREELALLYAERWQVEVDFRVLKSILRMDVLRCKTPEMLHKEIWIHLFGYNVIRTIMMDAARLHRTCVRSLSFKETLQLVEHFKELIWFNPSRSRIKHYANLLRSIKDRVKNRPHRIEPRLLKFNRKNYNLLKFPRSEARYGFWKQGKAWENRGRDYAFP